MNKFQYMQNNKQRANRTHLIYTPHSTLSPRIVVHSAQVHSTYAQPWTHFTDQELGLAVPPPGSGQPPVPALYLSPSSELVLGWTRGLRWHSGSEPGAPWRLCRL